MDGFIFKKGAGFHIVAVRDMKLGVDAEYSGARRALTPVYQADRKKYHTRLELTLFTYNPMSLRSTQFDEY
jgi:hypothetical protein